MKRIISLIEGADVHLFIVLPQKNKIKMFREIENLLVELATKKVQIRGKAFVKLYDILCYRLKDLQKEIGEFLVLFSAEIFVGVFECVGEHKKLTLNFKV